jgi:adenosylhomocysteine nucleosidase
VRKLNNDKKIGMNTTGVPLLGEIYSQLEQSVNTNAIERTTFLSIYIAMIAIIASIINEKGQGFFQKDYTLLYIILIGITLVGIILVIKINYIIYERQFLANQIRYNYFGKIYKEHHPSYINNMSIDILIILIMFIFLSIFIFGLLQSLHFFSTLVDMIISVGLFCLLALIYMLHRRAAKKSQLARSETKSDKIGIICPCDIEYKSCKKILKLINETKLAGRLISSRREKNVEVIAIQAGPGKIQCASATQLIIDKFQPNFIFDVGASGSLSEKLSINDIVCGEYSFEYDVCTSEELAKIPDDFITNTVLNKVSKEVLKEFSKWAKETMGAIIKIGNIACGEKDVDSKELRQELHKKLNAIACNWETSSVLKTAQLNEIKSFSFRVITDNADEKMDDDFNANCEKALEIMFSVLNKFIFEGWINKI